ncbi:MAG: hypothetical protein JNM86_15345 [Phycisphaerae bacterium]|nr:hypothetical protein [Phycisphaerae bacterium]
MVRCSIILALVFQSLLLLCCAGQSSVGRSLLGQNDGCSAQPGLHESECCCEDQAEPTQPATDLAAARTPERCCRCPLTVDAPRIPTLPERRPGIELSRTPVSKPEPLCVAPLASTSFSRFSVPLSSGPPDCAGRLACERFCRWTI